jgi:hypothetical protein
MAEILSKPLGAATSQVPLRNVFPQKAVRKCHPTLSVGAQPRQS